MRHVPTLAMRLFALAAPSYKLRINKNPSLKHWIEVGHAMELEPNANTKRIWKLKKRSDDDDASSYVLDELPGFPDTLEVVYGDADDWLARATYQGKVHDFSVGQRTRGGEDVEDDHFDKWPPADTAQVEQSVGYWLTRIKAAINKRLMNSKRWGQFNFSVDPKKGVIGVGGGWSGVARTLYLPNPNGQIYGGSWGNEIHNRHNFSMTTEQFDRVIKKRIERAQRQCAIENEDRLKDSSLQWEFSCSYGYDADEIDENTGLAKPKSTVRVHPTLTLTVDPAASPEKVAQDAKDYLDIRPLPSGTNTWGSYHFYRRGSRPRDFVKGLEQSFFGIFGHPASDDHGHTAVAEERLVDLRSQLLKRFGRGVRVLQIGIHTLQVDMAFVRTNPEDQAHPSDVREAIQELVSKADKQLNYPYDSKHTLTGKLKYEYDRYFVTLKFTPDLDTGPWILHKQLPKVLEVISDTIREIANMNTDGSLPGFGKWVTR